MIHIYERKSKKLPGTTSMFLVCEYNKDVIDIIKCCSERNWNQDTKEWEFPIYELASVLNKLVDIDNVELTVLRDKKERSLSIPPTYKFKLPPFDYQLEGIEYGLSHTGWILGDAQGLGKTLQMIHLAGILKETEGLKHCFVICGKASLKNNWVADIHKHSDLDAYVLGTRYYKKSGKPYIGSVADRVADLSKDIKEFFIITNIETIRDKNIVKALTSSKLGIDMIVLDEAHVCKDSTSQQGKNLLKLVKAKRRIALTGTLIMNSPLDAYVPLKWTGNESATLTYFKNRYCIYDAFRRGQITGYKNLDLLHKQLSTCMLRRTKEDKLNLPPKMYSVDYVDLTDKQAMLYENVKDQIRDEIDKVSLKTLNPMALSMRLRQCTAWTGILSSTVLESAKIDRVVDKVEEVVSQGDKALIFCVFKPAVDEIVKRLSKYGALSLTGDVTNDADMDEIKRKFQEDSNHKVLVGTWQKMGTGHTLTAANYVYFIDTPWTDADFEQCVDRAYRIGTTKNVFVTTFVAKNTFDERVLEIVEGKKSISDYVVSASISKESMKQFLGIS